MKQLFILVCLIAPLWIGAQAVEAEVRYDQLIKINIELPEGQEHLAKMLPSSQTISKVLFMKGSESLYRDLNEEEENETTIESQEQTEDGEVRMKMIIARPENKLYKNLETNQLVDSRDLMGRKFLIEDELAKFEWKMTGEQEEILGYTCQKATCEKDGDTIEAWFTTQIAASNGPGNYGQLPGLILKVVTDNGDRTIEATKVQLEAIDAEEIFIPNKGKKVTQAEFDEIEAKKRKEMEEENGGSGIQIKIRNN